MIIDEATQRKESRLRSEESTVWNPWENMNI